MAKAAAKLLWWRLRSSEFKFVILRHTVVGHQAVDALSLLKTEAEHENFLDDEVSDHTISQEILLCALQLDITDFEFIEKPEGPFLPFIQKRFIMVGTTVNRKAEILTLTEFITT